MRDEINSSKTWEGNAGTSAMIRSDEARRPGGLAEFECPMTLGKKLVSVPADDTLGCPSRSGFLPVTRFSDWNSRDSAHLASVASCARTEGSIEIEDCPAAD